MESLNLILTRAEMSELRLLFVRLLEVNEWDYDSLQTPFWRLYCPLATGGQILRNGKSYRLQPGKAVIIPANTQWGSKFDRSFRKICSHFYWTCGEVKIRQGIYEFELAAGELENLERMCRKPGTSLQAGTVLNLRITELICRCLETLPANCFYAENFDSRIRKIVLQMRSQLEKPLSNKQLANKLKMRETSFVRLFRDCVGQPPQKYYMGLRLEYAAQLLVSRPLMSIEEIAEACGFCDRNHFTRAFTAHWYCPPAAYRLRNR